MTENFFHVVEKSRITDEQVSALRLETVYSFIVNIVVVGIARTDTKQLRSEKRLRRSTYNMESPSVTLKLVSALAKPFTFSSSNAAFKLCTGDWHLNADSDANSN